MKPPGRLAGQSAVGLSERKVPVYQQSALSNQLQTASLNDLNEVESQVLAKRSIKSPSEVSRINTNKGSPFTPESTQKHFKDGNFNQANQK